MARNRATQRRHTKTLDPKLSVLDFFFTKEQLPDGSVVLTPRTEIVTREQLWWAMEWCFVRIAKQNAWYRRAWRFITRAPVVTYDPFALTRARGGITGPNLVEHPVAKKEFDAEGNVRVIEAAR